MGHYSVLVTSTGSPADDLSGPLASAEALAQALSSVFGGALPLVLDPTGFRRSTCGESLLKSAPPQYWAARFGHTMIIQLDDDFDTYADRLRALPPSLNFLRVFHETVASEGYVHARFGGRERLVVGSDMDGTHTAEGTPLPFETAFLKEHDDALRRWFSDELAAGQSLADLPWAQVLAEEYADAALAWATGLTAWNDPTRPSLDRLQGWTVPVQPRQP